jgi:hypothetical protein
VYSSSETPIRRRACPHPAAPGALLLHDRPGPRVVAMGQFVQAPPAWLAAAEADLGSESGVGEGRPRASTAADQPARRDRKGRRSVGLCERGFEPPRVAHHSEWQPGPAQIAAGSGADQRHAKIAAAPLNQSREAPMRRGRSTPPRGASSTPGSRGLHAYGRCASRRSPRSRASVEAAIFWIERWPLRLRYFGREPR